jgi:hypothetical protein
MEVAIFGYVLIRDAESERREREMQTRRDRKRHRQREMEIARERHREWERGLFASRQHSTGDLVTTQSNIAA